MEENDPAEKKFLKDLSQIPAGDRQKLSFLKKARRLNQLNLEEYSKSSKAIITSIVLGSEIIELG